MYILYTVIVLFLLSSTSASNLKSNINSHTAKELRNPLTLTPYITAGRIQDAKSDAEVHFDEFGDVVSYSGYFNVNSTANSNLFFWFFPSVNDYENDPVILWLEGGPGSSSLLGLFVENGPFVIEDNGTVSFRNYSWNKNHSVLYIDQPVGTGFSYTNGSLVTDENQVGEQLYSALFQFFSIFSELTTNDLFIAGKAYGGKYVPAIGYTILQKNKNTNWKINLKGLLIGNGWSDPVNQIHYGDLLYQIGFIDFNTLQTYKTNEELFIDYVRQEQYQLATDIFYDLISITEVVTGTNITYNFIKDNLDFPTAFETYLNRDDVREAIHVGSQPFEAENDDVSDALYEDISKSIAPWISELLSNYKVLIYNGNLDIIVGYVLTENYLLNLNFSSVDEYRTAPRNIWKIGSDHVAGYVKTAGNLTEVVVRNAGNSVVFDQPETAYELVYNFVRNISLV